MDKFLADIYLECFKMWILSQGNEQCRISLHDDKTIKIMTQYSESTICFYPNQIVEFNVTNKFKNEIELYLHFQFKNMKHTRELFNEMYETIQKLIKKPVVKVLLCCSGGLTTGYFAQKINEAVSLLSINIEVDAIAYDYLYEVGDGYDVIMLAPQISYLYAKANAILKNKIVLKIPSVIFAKYDVKEMISFIEEERINHKIIIDQNHKPLPVKNKKHTGKKILCMTLIRNSNRVHIAYRLYDGRNKILENNEIIKPTFKLQDFYDVIDSELAQYPDIAIIGVSVPGIIHEEYINSMHLEGIERLELEKDLQSRYHQKFIFGNDVNVMALGYYSMQEEYSSLSLIFQPISALSGIGNIVHGQLLIGAHHVSGEIQFMPLNYSKEPIELHTTPEGAVEALAKSIVSVISMLDPELIVICCFMITDVNEVIKEVEKYIPKDYIPHIEQVDYLQEFMLLGTLMLCHESI